MNKSIIYYILGWVLKLEGLFLLIPFLVAILYRESSGWYFLWVALGSLLAGSAVTWKKPDNTVFHMREGCIVTALSWIVLSLVGCLPFYFSGAIPSFANALFETVSGFTTTGSSILTDVEALPYCMLFWRSFTHWIGGMGVLVFLLAVIQLAGGSNMNLLRAESPGPSVGKLVPKIRYTARILYLIYFAMTVALIVFLVAGHMSLFEAVTTAFATAGTGGFSIRNDSLMNCTPYIQWVVSVFMILFGVNFNAYYLILLRKWKQVRRMEEIWCYFLIIGAAVAVIMLNTYRMAQNFGGHLRDTVFQVSSIITTTGFMTADFDLWPSASKCILVFLMFVGACAGSTGGGMKVSRLVLSVKATVRELGSYVYPRSIKKVKMDGRAVEEETIRGVTVYFIAYVLILTGSVFLLSFEGKDLITTFTAVAGTFNNIGPGLGLVGPTQNFAFFSTFGKFVMMFDMLAGRLELFPLLLLLFPPSWRGLLKKSRKFETMF